MDHAIRRLGPDDHEAYARLRLECLKTAPQAFGSEYEVEAQRKAEDWRTVLKGERVHFGAFDAGELVGTANFLQLGGTKERHKGMLGGVYVTPQHRGTGCSKALVETVIDHARTAVLQLHLIVSVDNHPARKLYDGLGFEIFGTEPRALYVNGRFHDEHLMVLFLD